MTFTEKFCSSDFLTKISRAREAAGMSKHDSTLPQAHPLLGLFLFDPKEEKVYRVEKAVKHWWWGNYIALLLVNDSDSHRLVYWENISCEDPHTLSAFKIDKFVVMS